MRRGLTVALVAPLTAVAMAGCTVDKTEEGVEVKPAEVEVEWDTTTVRTPDIDVIPRDSMRDTVRDTLPSR